MYDHKNVPGEVYSTMKKAFSKGTFLNNHNKGKYEFKKKEQE
ncbi:MAG: KTSC domain-containing protein [Chitinophagales bacterium]